MSAALQVFQPDTAELQTESSALVLRAEAIVITDEASYIAACNFKLEAAARRKTIVEKFADPKRLADEAHKAVCRLERELLDVVKRAEDIASGRITAHRDEQERIRREEELRLREEARRKEEDRLLAEALDAERDGDTAAAEEILSAPVVLPPVRIAPAVPKVAGLQFRESWKWELVSMLDLVKHCAAHPEDLCYLSLNTVNINRDVTTRKTAFNKPGLRAYKDTGLAAGGRK